MLKDAFEYREEIAERWIEASKNPDFKFWDADERYSFKPDIDPDFRRDRWASVNSKNELVGYLEALIDKNNSSVADVSVIKFVEDKTFSYDLVCFIRNMRRRYRCIRWACVVGNPTENNYDRIALLYGGRIVGVFKDKVRLSDGKFYDEKWYEVPRGSIMKKVPADFKA